MSDYIIATSSTCDLDRSWLEAHNIPFISYTYNIGEEVYEDDCREATRAAMYTAMREGARPKTSMINAYHYYEFFKPLVETGKKVIFLDMSQRLSSSYQNSLTAASMLREELPECSLYIMDTLCVSGGLGLLVKSMVKRMEEGMGYDELIKWGEANKLRIAHRFTVDDLNYLKAGGRVSNASALVGSLLSVKPLLYVPNQGTLDVARKVRGRRSAIGEMILNIISDLNQFDATGIEMDILHADCLEDARAVRAGVLANHPELGSVNISSLGVTIGAHCGPGLLTVFYFCNGRRP